MAKTQPAWKVGDPSPAGGGAMVHYRPATAEEWAAFTHRETPRSLPPRVDTANPDQIAELGELYVDEATGYKTRVKPDAGAGDAPGAQTGDRSGTRSDTGAASQAGQPAAAPAGQTSGGAGGGVNLQDEVDRLRAENARLSGARGAQG